MLIHTSVSQCFRRKGWVSCYLLLYWLKFQIQHPRGTRVADYFIRVRLGHVPYVSEGAEDKSDHFLADGAIRLWARVRCPVLQTAHMAGFTRGQEQDSAWHMPTVRETWDHIICKSWKSSWSCCSYLFFLFCFVLFCFVHGRVTIHLHFTTTGSLSPCIYII